MGARVVSSKCGRHLAVECRQDRLHIQFAFAFEYLFLQLLLTVYEFLRKRAFPTVYIHHPVPRKERRTGEGLSDVVLTESELLPHFHKHRFFSRDVERLGDAVEGHPVYHPGPLLPAPPRHSVSVGAVVQEEPVPGLRFYGYFFRNRRQTFRHIQRVFHIPGHCREAVVLEVIVQTECHRVGIVAPDDDFAPFAFKGESVQGVGKMNEFEL